VIARDLIEGIGGYSGLFLFCAASGIVFPVPEDLALVYAGMRIEAGALSWIATILVTMSGVLVRDTVAYGIGRGLGDLLLDHPVVGRMVGVRRLERARHLVEDRGAGAVLVGRFLVGFRAPVFLACGAARMPLARFLAWDLLGLCAAVPLALLLGFVFGAPLFEAVFSVLTLVRPYVVTLSLASVFAGAAWLVAHRERD
jgi:membrane protein DedA with SNARE-associated domain